MILDVNKCASSPCQNGGTCRDLVNAKSSRVTALTATMEKAVELVSPIILKSVLIVIFLAYAAQTRLSSLTEITNYTVWPA